MRALWFKGLSFTRIYRRLILLERSLSASLPEPAASTPMHVTLLAAHEVDAYLALRPDQDPAEIRARLDEGQLCYAVWQGRRIIYAQWAVIRRAHIAYLACCLELAPDEVYAYDAFAAPGARGLGASPLATFRTFQQFRERGYRRVLGAVLPENHAPLRVSEKTGLRPIALIGFIGLGPWRRLFCRGSQIRMSG